MGPCALFWILFALLVAVAVVVWRKSPRPGRTEGTANLDGKVRRIFLYLVGFIALWDLFAYLREGRPSNLLFALALLVYLVYSAAYAKLPPSRSIEALALLAMLALGGASFYLSICLGR